MSVKPKYALSVVRELCVSSQYVITVSALKTSIALGFTQDDIIEVVMSLTENDLYKSMPSELIPELFQDVYRVHYEDISLYVKLQIADDGVVVVVSFKEL